MQVEYHRWHSPALGRDMELKAYGHYGKPLLVFPSSDGRFFDYENFGMIDACAPFIDAGRVKVYCADGLDGEAWLNHTAHPAERGRRYGQYEAHIVDEVVPFIYRHCRAARIDIMVSGCSMGAYHAGNFFFKHPFTFDTAILLSGMYSLNFAVGDYLDERVYHNDPLRYLPDLNDPDILELLRRNRIVIACGQGRWEEECLADSHRLSAVLHAKGVAHWLDLWGRDVDHDWPWWRKMIVHHLGQVGV